VACSVVPHRRSDPGPALGALKVTFDLSRPDEGKTAVKGLSGVVDQLWIIVKVFLNSSPGPQYADSSASNAQGVRIAFHGCNATPVVASYWSRVRWDASFLKAVVFFSLVGIVNLGFEGLDFGSWMRSLTFRQYDLKARGWLHTPPGSRP
jgi:hypothetical protein